MKRHWWIALGLSLCLHGIGGATLKESPPQGSNKSGKGNRPGSGEDGDGSDEEGSGEGRKKVKIKLGPIHGENGEIIETSPLGKTGEPCLEYFGGIGVYHDGWGVITNVIPNYPAARAGMQVGDRVIDMVNVVGEVGTSVTLTFIRNNVSNTITVKRERICTRHQ
jgi:hypothetical protein